ncbi:sn-glycerol-3-phosphate import ATP-binding protein UgpC [Mesorhizobium sp. Z1-4]|uniref:sn-glycerol-3-phosphate import ATP-binding protein UgpC n=1 Tax=Mesorhizobium sp. Z1-4 TaxID=2448478 RepID=UPI000FDBF2A1|nr:sn-glycerol-3-phosphate import ATP-binding protein UgpC [Mesorhizobium sp. Z1-4]
MAQVHIERVSKIYSGTQRAVNDISIDIPDGEFVVLVGPSGCGKSTLLRMVAGLESITEGKVSIGDRVVNGVDPAERDIAMVFQNYALYPHMKVYDNMAYGLRNRGMPKAEIDRRVREAAKTLELEHLLERRPRELSGGQRQRVAMGRAIVRSPKVFLFDEPLSNLDAKLRGQMRVEIRNLQKRFGVTSIYVTHDQVEAMTLADTLVVMNNGVAEQIGSPLDVYERPASAFVAGFIGAPAMNLIEAVVEGDGRALAVGASRLAPFSHSPALEPGRPVTLGIRPEHLRRAHANEKADMDLVVSAAEILGADTLAHGRIAPGGTGAAPLIVRLPGNVRLETGARLPLVLEPGAAHLFDGETGRRIDLAEAAVAPQQAAMARA